MGMIILVTAFLLEISFAIFCIITKSDHIKANSILRIIFFASFVLLAVLTVIDWSFRYYALGFLSLLLAIIGGIALIRKKGNDKEFKVKRVILKSIGMVILLFAVIAPAIVFPQNKAVVGTTGKYPVFTQTETYVDQNRIESYSDAGINRKLNVQFWYPDRSNGTYPLVVFSHGGLGVKSSNESLYNELASHGYVVCSIDHTFQCFYTTDDSGDTTLINLNYMQELLTEDPQSDMQQSYDYYQKWMKIRTMDIDFVIDHIIEKTENNNTEFVYKLVDIDKIGVMGHSLGGSAALGIGRIRDDIKAVIALESPFLYDIEGVDDKRFVFTDEIYPVPVLNVYSDSSWHILSERPQYESNDAMLSDFDSTTSAVYISGVGHLALTDFSLTSPFLTQILDGQEATTKATDCLRIINEVCLDFFNSYLKGENN